MSTRRRKRSYKSLFRERFFRETGMSFDRFLLYVGALLCVCIAMVLTVKFRGAVNVARQEVAASTASDVEATRILEKTDQEVAMEMATLPEHFEQRKPLEKIAILEDKIAMCDVLIEADSEFSDEAKERRIRLFGFKCLIESVGGQESNATFEELKAIRSQAQASGNEARLATANFILGFSATSRLKIHNELADFRFAAAAILDIDATTLTNVGQAAKWYNAMLDLFGQIDKTDYLAKLALVLGTKFADSPSEEISNMGLNLKDYPYFGEFYRQIKEEAYTSRDDKFRLFRDLFTQIAATPPQGFRTYQTTIAFFDRLLNADDVKYGGILSKKLASAAALAVPRVENYVSSAVANFETRVARINKKVDLSGNQADGTPLDLPSYKSTVVIFWSESNPEAARFIKFLPTSDRFDVWATNVLIATLTELSEDDVKRFSRSLAHYTLLDNATSTRLMQDLGVDRVPYIVNISKDRVVTRMGTGDN